MAIAVHLPLINPLIPAPAVSTEARSTPEKSKGGGGKRRMGETTSPMADEKQPDAGPDKPKSERPDAMLARARH